MKLKYLKMLHQLNNRSIAPLLRQIPKVISVVPNNHLAYWEDVVPREKKSIKKKPKNRVNQGTFSRSTLKLLVFK